jgi:hypothetical protein
MPEMHEPNSLPIFDARHLNRHLRERWASHGIKLRGSERMGVSVRQILRSAAKRRSTIDMPYVDLWVAALDEFISWMISLFTVVYSQETQHSNFDRSVWVILAKAIADAMAIRHLIVAGYDVQAKILVRSAGEYLELLVCILDDPHLADEFVLADTPEAARDFWLKHLARGQVRKRMKAAWSNFFGSDDNNSGASKWFSNWGNGWAEIFSSLLHPSFMGGVFSAIALKTSYPDDDSWIGFMGDRTDASVDTIRCYAAYLFPVLLLHRKYPFETFDAVTASTVQYDENNEFHRHVKIGRDILASLVLSFGSEQNDTFVEPQIDYTIFPEDCNAA